MATEHDLQNSILDLFRLKNYPITRTNAGRVQNALTGSWVVMAENGHPDLICGLPHNGVYVLAYIECKSPKGTVDVAQIQFLRRMHKLNIPWLIACDMDDVTRWLRDWSYHGKPKFADQVLNEDIFIPTRKMTSKRQKMSMSTLLEYNRFMDKKV